MEAVAPEMLRGSKLPRLGARAEMLGVELPMFARHEHRARARDKSAGHVVAGRRCGKLKLRAAVLSENGSSGLPVRHFVGEFIGIGEAVAHGHGIGRLRRKCRCAIRPRQKGGYCGDHNKRLIHRGPHRNKLVVGSRRASHPLDGPQAETITEGSDFPGFRSDCLPNEPCRRGRESSFAC